MKINLAWIFDKELISQQNTFVFPSPSFAVLQDTEEALATNLRDSQVLLHKENLDWNWNLIGTILKVSRNNSATF